VKNSALHLIGWIQLRQLIRCWWIRRHRQELAQAMHMQQFGGGVMFSSCGLFHKAALLESVKSDKLPPAHRFLTPTM